MGQLYSDRVICIVTKDLKNSLLKTEGDYFQKFVILPKRKELRLLHISVQLIFQPKFSHAFSDVQYI